MISVARVKSSLLSSISQPVIEDTSGEVLMPLLGRKEEGDELRQGRGIGFLTRRQRGELVLVRLFLCPAAQLSDATVDIFAHVGECQTVGTNAKNCYAVSFN